MKLKMIVAMTALVIAAQANAAGGRTVTPDATQQQSAAQVGKAAQASATEGRAKAVRKGLVSEKVALLKEGTHTTVLNNLETLMSQDAEVTKAVIAIVKADGVPNDIKTKQLIGISSLKPGDISKKSTDVSIGAEKTRAQAAEIFTIVAVEIAKMADPKAKAEAMEMLTLTTEAILQGKSVEEAMNSYGQNAEWLKNMICKCAGRC